MSWQKGPFGPIWSDLSYFRAAAADAEDGWVVRRGKRGRRRVGSRGGSGGGGAEVGGLWRLCPRPTRWGLLLEDCLVGDEVVLVFGYYALFYCCALFCFVSFVFSSFFGSSLCLIATTCRFATNRALLCRILVCLVPPSGRVGG